MDTLQSLLDQDYPELEILVSDDCSNDNSFERCQAFLAAHPNARVLRPSARLGWVGNLNYLIAQAQGDYCFILGHDDFVL